MLRLLWSLHRQRICLTALFCLVRQHPQVCLRLLIRLSRLFCSWKLEGYRQPWRRLASQPSHLEGRLHLS